MDLQGGGVFFPPFMKPSIYLSSSLLSPCHSPTLSNLKGLEQSAHTHAREGRTKNPQTKKIPTIQQNVNCIKGSMPGPEMRQGTGRCKWRRGSKQYSDTETKSRKEKLKGLYANKKKSQLEKHSSPLQITAVQKYQASAYSEIAKSI